MTDRQVFVKKSALAGSDPIVVVANFPDDPMMARDAQGTDCTPLCLPAEANDQTNLPPLPSVLRPDWRDHMQGIVNEEAERRIDEAFPLYMQNNANADINNSTLLYGANAATWPQDAKDRKAENDRGWNYVSAVRQAADALEHDNTLVDPT